MKMNHSPILLFVVLVLALSIVPMQAFAASGFGYELTITDSSLPHNGTGTMNIRLNVPADIPFMDLIYFNASGVDGVTLDPPSITHIIEYGAGGTVETYSHSYQVSASATEPVIHWMVVTQIDPDDTNTWAETRGSFPITVEHAYEDTVVPATCTEDGYTEHTCTVCDYSYRDAETTALGHHYDVTETVTPTCTEDGYTTYTCQLCGDSFKSFLRPLGHDFASALTTPTCTAPGYALHTCLRCGDSYKDNETPALGHDYASTLTKPTCTAPGYTAHTCLRCGDSFKDNETPALGHDPGEWEVSEPATNKKAGLETLSCLRCGGLLDSRKIPLLAETWPDNTACSEGLRFRDEAPELTDNWYMYTPVDLTKDGVLEVPLIASNRYRIGTARVTVKDGQMSANYQVTADKVQVKQEFMAFLPGLEGLESVESEAMEDLNVPFNTPVDIASLGGSQALFFMRLMVTYDIYADGVQWWITP